MGQQGWIANSIPLMPKYKIIQACSSQVDNVFAFALFTEENRYYPTWRRKWMKMGLRMCLKFLLRIEKTGKQRKKRQRTLSQLLPLFTQSCPTLCNPRDCSTPGFLSFTISQNLLRLMSIESVMPSNHLILCRPLLLLPSVFPSIRVFSDDSALHFRWPKYWSFSISPCNIWHLNLVFTVTPTFVLL